MKIAIVGYSGSGKSTLARRLGEYHHAEVLHLDTVHHLPGWKERDRESEKQIVRAFLDEHAAWVIDGNYFKLFYEQRMEEADLIVMLLFNRFNCLYRAYKRYRKYKDDVQNAECFSSDSTETKWICLNCGHVVVGKEPPKICPVCSHDQGYFKKA